MQVPREKRESEPNLEESATPIESASVRQLMMSYLGGAAVLFVVLVLIIHGMPYLSIDVAITRFLQSFRNPALDLFMKTLGLPGYFPQTIVLNALFVAILYLCRMKWAALTVLVVGSMVGLSGSVLRWTIDRPRPDSSLVWVAQRIENGHFSFPSGHVVGFTAVLGFIIFLGITQLKSSWHRNLLLVLIGFYIVLVGISRVYVGEHWASDVLGGYLYGSICLIVMILFYRWVRVRFGGRSAPIIPTVN